MQEEVEKGTMARKIDHFFDILGFAGFLFLVPVFLLVLGIEKAAGWS